MPRILVVDDEPLISMLVEGWLNELGCEVVGPATSAQDGLNLIGSGRLDAAILDINLGGEDSFSVAGALRDIGVPFAFATGDSGVEASAGFKDPILLHKPFDFEEVKSVLAQLLKAPGAS